MKWAKLFALAATLLAAAVSPAVPVKPDLQKILKQQEQRPKYFEPARAGWNGPEMQRAEDAAPNSVLEAYGPKATARAIRAGLLAAAIPDPKAVVAIAAVILLMRLLKQVQEKKRRVTPLLPMATNSEHFKQEQKAA